MKRYLIAAFVVLQILDVLTTFYFLHTGHAVEGNPFINLMMVHFGTWWWVPKLALALSTVPFLIKGRTRYVAVMVGLYSFVIVNNMM